MKTKILLLMSAVILASGCGQKSNDSKKPELVFRDSIDDKIDLGPELTSDQKAKLKILFKEQFSLKFLEDVYTKVDESSADSQARKKRLENASPEEIDMIAEVMTECQIQDPVEETQSFEGEPRAGATEQTKKASSMTGEKCPLEKTEAAQKNLEIVSYDPNSETGSLTISANEKDSLILKSPKWMEKLGIIARSTTIETKWNVRQLEESRGFYMQRKISGYHKHYGRDGGSLSIAGTGEAVDIKDVGEGQRLEMVLRLQLSTEGLQAEMSWIRKIDGTGEKNQFFLNGHPIEESEYRDLFGNAFDKMLWPVWYGQE